MSKHIKENDFRNLPRLFPDFNSGIVDFEFTICYNVYNVTRICSKRPEKGVSYGLSLFISAMDYGNFKTQNENKNTIRHKYHIWYSDLCDCFLFYFGRMHSS